MILDRRFRWNRHPVAMWLIASLVYTGAVAQRSAIGVSIEAASSRYGVNVLFLSILPVVQLAVYAVMQLPAGRLLDRFGSRWTLTVGAFAIALGQLALAVADDLVLACASRLLVSAGDSVAFISVLRLVLLRLPARRATLLAQLTGVIGQIGAVAAAAPFLLLLQTWTWTPALLAASALGIFAALAALVAVRDTPSAVTSEPRLAVKELWRDPGVRLGYWIHFTTTFPATGFLLYWGMPYLTTNGLTPRQAGLSLSAVSLTGIAVGVIAAMVVLKWPNRGFALCMTVSFVCIAFWSMTLSFSTPPTWLIVSTGVVMGSSAPCGVVAFKFLRPAYSTATSSAATGLVNSAGFTSSVLAIGAVAAATAAAAHWRLDDPLRVGLSAQLALWTVGLTLMAANFRGFRERVKLHEWETLQHNNTHWTTSRSEH